MTHASADDGRPTPYVEIDRAEWAELAGAQPSPLEESEISRLRGLGDHLDLAEVSEVYLPLSALLSLYATNTQSLYHETNRFLRHQSPRTPFVIGVAGSVAVGKSTVARILATLLSRWPDTPSVELVTTDGFLLPNAELERRGIMARKGFPESYDRKALLRFISTIKSGAAEAHAPVYSHVSYDIVPDATIAVRQPDILIVEGLNVLQPALPGHGLSVGDLFDFTVYVDARMKDIERWYVERFLALQHGAFNSTDSYFHRYADLTEAEATATALDIWKRINEPNLVQNILPTRSRASLVLRKGPDHTVQTVLLRKL